MSDRYKSVYQIHWAQKLKCVWGTITDLTGSHASHTHIYLSFGFNGNSLMDSWYYIFFIWFKIIIIIFFYPYSFFFSPCGELFRNHLWGKNVLETIW